MTQVQEESMQRHCPRCGGEMLKLPGSSFYWHADYTHPRCDITNIVDFPKDEQVVRSAPPLSSDKEKGKEKRPKK
jgi:hypothetical protein